MAVVAVGTGGDADYHRRFVLRTVGDVLWAYHRRFVTRTGGDKQYHQRFVFRTGGDKPVQYKTPTPPSSHHLSSPTRRPHLSPPLLLPKFSWNLTILDVLAPPTYSKVSSHQFIGFVPIFLGLMMHFVMNWSRRVFSPFLDHFSSLGLLFLLFE